MPSIKTFLKGLGLFAVSYIIMRNLENRGPQASAVRKLTGSA